MPSLPTPSESAMRSLTCPMLSVSATSSASQRAPLAVRTTATGKRHSHSHSPLAALRYVAPVQAACSEH